jgi:hypothetical protein
MTERDSNASGLSPESIFKVATGFMASKHLFIANEVGMFSALADGPLALHTIAERIGVPSRTLRIIADAMVVLGFLSRHDDVYENSAVVQSFLSGRGPTDMRPFLRFWNALSYPTWLGLEASIRTGASATQGKTPTPEEERILSEGIEAINAGGAQALPHAYDFAPHRKLLNIGGWYVSFLLPVLRHCPKLQATLVMLPQWFERAQAVLAAESSLAPRVSVQEGDYLCDELPRSHDIFLVTNIAHHFSPEHNVDFLNRLKAYADPGTRLLYIDFWTDARHLDPPFAALMAAEFQTLSGEGDVYSVDEARGWLAKAGWRFLDHRPLNGPSTIVVAEAV